MTRYTEQAGVPRQPVPAGSGGAGRKTILVVDDERDLVDLITYNLQRNGYDVMPASSGDEALSAAQKRVPDLVVLDLMLPGIDGIEVARRLRADARTADVPVIMLTAKGEEADVLVGLAVGADDYVTKPFSMKILMARVGAVLRRAEARAAGNVGVGTGSEVLRAGPLTIDLARHEALVEGDVVRLTLTEFRLLKGLVEARGRVLSRDQLMDKGMGEDVFVTDRAIDVHVTAIRKKLGKYNWLVRTVRGVGYRLQETPEEKDDG